MKPSEEPFHIGGLFRCCTGSLALARTDDKPPAEEGDIVKCLYCSESMIFHNGAWVWNRPREET